MSTHGFSFCPTSTILIMCMGPIYKIWLKLRPIHPFLCYSFISFNNRFIPIKFMDQKGQQIWNAYPAVWKQFHSPWPWLQSSLLNTRLKIRYSLRVSTSADFQILCSTARTFERTISITYNKNWVKQTIVYAFYHLGTWKVIFLV